MRCSWSTGWQRRGCAAALLGWLVTEAQRLGCGQLHLDSGMGPEREDAHRLYFNHGLRIVSYHFARGLPAAAGETPRGLSAAAGETPGR